MSLLFGAVVRSIGNVTCDFLFDRTVFASVSYNLCASHSPVVFKDSTSQLFVSRQKYIQRC